MAGVDGAGKLSVADYGAVYGCRRICPPLHRGANRCSAAAPGPFPAFEPVNKIDELVLANLRKLGLPPAELCTDGVFLRRIFLDVIGSLPTPEEARAFLADGNPTKRARVD